MLAGVMTLVLLALTMVARGVDRVEVIAAVLYIGVFIGVVTADVIGGVSGALVAAAIYMVLRFDAIEVLGPSRFSVLIVVRLLSYLAFGLIGGLSWKLLRERLDKLETFDTIDDATLLLNARGMADVIDHEMTRARRYEETFVVTTVQFSMELVGALKMKQRQKVLSVLGATTRDTVRSVDRVGITSDDRSVTIVVLSPLTTIEGGHALARRVTEALADALLPLNVPVGRKLDHHHFLFPGDSVEIGALKDQLLHRTAIEFPDAVAA